MAVTFVNQPLDWTGQVDEDFGFYVDATGDSSLTYRWQFSSNGGSSYSNSTQTGYNTPYLHSNITSARYNYLYRCRITENGTYYYSDPVRLIQGVTPRSLTVLKKLWDEKTNIRAAIVNKGVTVPVDAKQADFPTYIAQIGT